MGFPIRSWLAFGSAVFVDYSSGRLSVDAVVAEAAGDFDGAEYSVTAGVGCVDFFDDAIKSGEDFAAALVPEADGVDVAVEAREAGELVVVDDTRAGRPVEEGLVDGLAIGVVADGAFAGVAFGGWGCIAGTRGVRPGCCVHRFSFGAVGAV